MGRRATRELIEAAAALEPADRALVNLWIHRGLGDDRLAELTGMSAVAVQARRERILARLGEQLGRSPDEVLAALRADGDEDEDEDAGDADDSAGTDGDGHGDGDDPGVGRPDVTATAGGLNAPATVSTAGLPSGPQAEPEALDGEPRAEPDAAVAAPRGSPGGATTSTSRHRSRIWASFTAAVAIVVAVVLVVLLAGGGSSPRPAAGPTTSAATPPTTAAPPGAGSTATTSSTTATAATSSSTATTPHNGKFAGLPGPNELAHVSGIVRLVGKVGHLKLKLTVKDLPLVHHAHYEAWLFNSVVDSRALGHVTRGVANFYRLPSGARRFHSIDVSVQVKGTKAHSGVSEVRAVNPVDGPRNIVRRARSRKPHSLHRALAAGHHERHAARARHRSAPHSTHRARESRHAPRRGTRRHDARHHATRHHRRGKRSKKAKTSK